MANKVILVGNIGKNPEIKYMQNGDAVTNLSVATTEKWKNKEGGYTEHTEWHRVVCFKRLAEICGEYLSKGSKVYIEGKLKTRSWEKDGTTRYTTEIIADKLEMLGGGDSRPTKPKQAQTRGHQPPAEDDIPF